MCYISIPKVSWSVFTSQYVLWRSDIITTIPWVPAVALLASAVSVRLMTDCGPPSVTRTTGLLSPPHWPTSLDVWGLKAGHFLSVGERGRCVCVCERLYRQSSHSCQVQPKPPSERDQVRDITLCSPPDTFPVSETKNSNPPDLHFNLPRGGQGGETGPGGVSLVTVGGSDIGKCSCQVFCFPPRAYICHRTWVTSAAPILSTTHNRVSWALHGGKDWNTVYCKL